MPTSLETPVQTSLLSEEIGDVIGTLTDVLEPMNLQMILHKPNTIDRLDIIENHLLSLKANYENFKEWSTKNNEENENRLLTKENPKLKQKIKELDAFSK